MDEVKKNLKIIYQKERGLLWMMILLFLVGGVLLIVSLVNLNPSGTLVKIGYGDLGGYRDGTWVDMLVFPLFVVLVGLGHNLLITRIYEKRGGGMAKVVAMASIALLAGAFVVLVRLLGEG